MLNSDIVSNTISFFLGKARKVKASDLKKDDQARELDLIEKLHKLTEDIEINDNLIKSLKKTFLGASVNETFADKIEQAYKPLETAKLNYRVALKLKVAFELICKDKALTKRQEDMQKLVIEDITESQRQIKEAENLINKLTTVTAPASSPLGDLAPICRLILTDLKEEFQKYRKKNTWDKKFPNFGNKDYCIAQSIPGAGKDTGPGIRLTRYIEMINLPILTHKRKEDEKYPSYYLMISTDLTLPQHDKDGTLSNFGNNYSDIQITLSNDNVRPEKLTGFIQVGSSNEVSPALTNLFYEHKINLFAEDIDEERFYDVREELVAEKEGNEEVLGKYREKKYNERSSEITKKYNEKIQKLEQNYNTLIDSNESKSEKFKKLLNDSREILKESKKDLKDIEEKLEDETLKKVYDKVYTLTKELKNNSGKKPPSKKDKEAYLKYDNLLKTAEELKIIIRNEENNTKKHQMQYEQYGNEKHIKDMEEVTQTLRESYEDELNNLVDEINEHKRNCKILGDRKTKVTVTGNKIHVIIPLNLVTTHNNEYEHKSLVEKINHIAGLLEHPSEIDTSRDFKDYFYKKLNDIEERVRKDNKELPKVKLDNKVRLAQKELRDNEKKQSKIFYEKRIEELISEKNKLQDKFDSLSLKQSTDENYKIEPSMAFKVEITREVMICLEIPLDKRGSFKRIKPMSVKVVENKITGEKAYQFVFLVLPPTIALAVEDNKKKSKEFEDLSVEQQNAEIEKLFSNI